jgi:mannose-1-phosphate guanylyltransferase
MVNAVIMAGGAGTRLWPLSRRDRPKQLLRLVQGRSLLRESYERLAALLHANQIHVITAARYLPLVAAELPEVPEENLIGEPEGRDTANAVALAAAILHERDPEGVMGVFTADHIITPVGKFTDAVDQAFRTAHDYPAALVTMGITVRFPETAFGYVKRGERIAGDVYRVDRFTEKPDADLAGRYVASGDYYWNSGMFAWRTSAILKELETNLPVTYQGVTKIAQAWTTPRRQEILDIVYPGLQRISIDFAVMERARNVMVVEMNCSWADVGSWTKLGEALPADQYGMVTAAKRAVQLGCHGTTVVSEDDAHLIATVGLNDLIVVHSPDATLICRKSDDQRLKELLALIEAEHGQKYL